MPPASDLRERFEADRRHKAFHPLPVIEGDGLTLGRGTVLARMGVTRSGDAVLAIDADQERVLVLLSAVYGRQQSPIVIKQIGRASERWRQGDAASAHIELAYARLPRLPSDEDAFRLFLAEELLADGMTPRQLAAALGFDPELLKYDPSEPRVPAGNGAESGRWTSGGAGGGSSAFVVSMAAARAMGRPLLGGASASAVRALATFAARFSVPTAVLGALLIPTPNSGGVTEGTLPDAPDVSFRKDGPAGLLQLTTTAADGSDVLVAARNQRGLYVDVVTGKPIGRDLGGQLYLDFEAVQDSITAALGHRERIAPDATAAGKRDEPKLCPAPRPDTAHGSSEQAKDYEDDVHRRVNPIAPIPRGFAVLAISPITGREAYFDDCFRYAGDLVDGDMKRGDFAEAKGPRYAALLRFGGKPEENVMDQLTGQAEQQTAVAKDLGVRVKWYFAEPYAAEHVRKKFGGDFPELVIATMPPTTRARRRR